MSQDDEQLQGYGYRWREVISYLLRQPQTHGRGRIGAGALELGGGLYLRVHPVPGQGQEAERLEERRGRGREGVQRARYENAASLFTYPNATGGDNEKSIQPV